MQLLFMENLSFLIRYDKVSRSNQLKIGYISRSDSAEYRNIETFVNASGLSWLEASCVKECGETLKNIARPSNVLQIKHLLFYES